MAKNSIRDYSATNSANTDIQSVDIDEGCSPAGINNALREIMVDLKNVSTGAVALESPAADSLTVTGAFTSQGIDDNATSTAMTLDSGNNVGIGTASPTDTAGFGVALDVSSSTGAAVYVRDAGGSKTGYFGQFNEQTSIVSRQDDGNIAFYTGASPSEKVRITSGGNVGIGTDSTLGSKMFVAQGAAASPSTSGNMTTGMVVGSSITGEALNVGTDASGAWYNAAYANNAGVARIHRWLTGGSERLRLTSDGNLLVGTTDTTLYNNTSGTGVCYRNGASLDVLSASDNALILNRTGSDGQIAEFRKSGAIVGSVGTTSGDFYVTKSGTNQTGIYFNELGMLPMTSGSISDNSRDIGQATYRWDDIYATNGTIQTSDANEKQQIASLTDAEITAAKAISALFKTYKWNDSVNEKGDDARTHTGVIAQDVQQAMTDAGLDAGDYAFFISSTWWETQTDVPAVDAVAEVLDEDGNVVTEAVEAKEAYTRTDTYDTADEAPEGAVERTRLGVRYPELLAFVGAATEQRLANIESRLDALEAE